MSTATARRVSPLTTVSPEYVAEKKSRNGSGGGTLAGVTRRLRPSITSRFLRSNTLSVPAHERRDSPTRDVSGAGVTLPKSHRDPAALIAAAAANPDVSDRAMRVYVVVAQVFDRGVSAADVAATLPQFTEDQAARLLGTLVTAGLLESRFRTVGYTEGRRVRRRVYTLAGGAL